MREEFTQAAVNLVNPYVTQWKDAGKKVIGYPCTFTPEEIIHAAGMLPFRLRGIGAESTTFADAYFGPVICSFPKCILELAGHRQYNFLDGTVVSDGCDAARRMDECWRKAGEEHDGICPSFFHYFSTPHKVSDYSLKWFIGEIRQLKKHMEDYFEIEITDNALREAIGVYNHSRQLLQKLAQWRMSEAPPISGTDAQAVILASTAMPREIFNTLLEEMLVEFEAGPVDKPTDQAADGVNGKRLLLAGSAIDDVDLVRLIESAGAMVVGDNQCFGSRSFVDLDSEDQDPLEALATRYLDKTACPRMFGYYKDRFQFLKEQVDAARADGVILQNIRFCDLHGADNGLFIRDLEAEGIPCLMLEREYGPLTEEGRILMRVDAFLESIA